LDPYCVLDPPVVNDVTQYATCNQCKAYPNQYLTTGPPENTIENPRYLAGKHRKKLSHKKVDDSSTCHADCDYASYGMYKSTQGQVSSCKACNADCIRCTSDTNCNECIYSKRRMQSPANINNFLMESYAGTLSCSASTFN